MPSKPFFSSCRTFTTVLHCLANYFLTIPASTGHSLCKPSAAAAAAGVYGVVAWTAKQVLLVVFSRRRQRQKEPVQVPPLTSSEPRPQPASLAPIPAALSGRRQWQNEPVQVPPLTSSEPSPSYSVPRPVAELAANPLAEMSLYPANTRDLGTRDFGLGMMQAYEYR